MAKHIAEAIKPSKFPDFLSLDLKEYPKAKDYKIGHKCELVVKAELVSISKDEYGDGDKNTRVRFKVLGVKEHSHGQEY